MSDYEKIINNLMNQVDWLRICNQMPNRVILGIEIVKILNAYCKDYYFEYKVYDDSCFVMGIPVTIDYKDKWIMMVCAGNESDGKYVLRQ